MIMAAGLMLAPLSWAEVSETCVEGLGEQSLSAHIAACEAALTQSSKSDRLKVLLSLANLALKKRDYPLVTQYLEQARGARGFEQDIAAKYRYYRLLGLLHWYQKQLDIAQGHLLQARDLAEQLKDPALYAKSLNELGVIESARGQHKQALNFLQQSLHIKQSLKDDFGSAVSLSNIGLAHLRMEAYEDAERFYLEALQHYGRYTAAHPDDQQAWHSLTHLYEDLTLLYSRYQKPEKSAEYATLLIQQYRELLSADEQVRVLATLASTQMNAKQWSVAETLLAQMESLLLASPGIQQPTALLVLARFKQHQQQWSSAQGFAEQARDLAKAQQLLEHEASAWRLLAEVAQQQQRDSQALAHFQQYLQLREQFLAARYDQELGVLRQNLVREHLQRQLAETQAINEQQSAAIHRLTAYVLASLLLLLMTVSGAGVVVYRKRQQQQQLQQEIAQHRQQLLLLQADHQATNDTEEEAPTAESMASASDPSPPFKRQLVEAMISCIELWEKATQTNRVELADRSKIWTVTIDDGRLRTRSMDKYLSLDKLPAHPRWRNVVQTCHYVLAECPLSPEDRARLNSKLDAIMNSLRAQALAN
ncbi:tetratricopeptide repeat protein [Permianibacter aggregans]|nr:tetratricopeptide repeat protein [Permianibacter aggregans]